MIEGRTHETNICKRNSRCHESVSFLRRHLFGEYALLGKYHSHPDPQQERFFFALLRECLEQGIVNEDLIREEMRRDHVRHDALELIERTPLPEALLHSKEFDGISHVA